MTQRNQGKTAVVGWGRGMGHKGHMLLASAVIHQAKAINATPIFILSRTSLIDPSTGDLWADTKKVRATKDDPLTPQEKLAIYQKTFPDNAKIFTVADGESGSLNDALANLAKQGFSNIVLVVGADQKAAFQYLVNPSKDGSIPYQQMGLQNLSVMSRQETQAPGSDIEGPRATPMRQVLLDPKISDEQKFAVWRDAMPDALSDKEVLGLMRKAQQRLGRAEQVAPPKQQKIKEFIQRVRPMLKEASVEKKLEVLKFIKEAISTKNKPKKYKVEVTFVDGKKDYVEIEHTGEELSSIAKLASTHQLVKDKFPDKEIRSIMDPSIEEDRFDNQKETVRLPPEMTGRDPSKPYADIGPYTISMRGDDATTQQDARHLGTILSSVPNPLTKAAGMAMRYAGQYDKLPTGEKVARAIDSAGTPDEISRYLKKKAVKEQGKKMNPLNKRFEPEVPNDAELDYQGSERGRFPHYYEIRDDGAAFELELENGKKYTVEPGHPEWDTLYKQHFDLPTPNDEVDWYIGNNPLVEIDDPYNLPNRHSMDYGMRKTMIRRLAKATDYDVSDLSLASDEELSDLYKEVFPDDSINEDYLDEK